jgi:hypothetical protein
MKHPHLNEAIGVLVRMPKDSGETRNQVARMNVANDLKTSCNK